jgi:hypothetical protein
MMSTLYRVPLFALTLVLAGCNVAKALVSAVGGGTCNGPIAIAATGSASGSTGSSSCKMPDGSMGTLYTLTLAQPTSVAPTVAANGFTAYLGAWTASGSLIGQINTTPTRLKLFLAPGSYQFGVSAVGDKDGSFTFSTPPAEVTACTAGAGGSISGIDNGIAMKGAVITGALTSDDCGGGTTRNDGYGLFGATAGSSWTFDLTADRAATVLVAVGSQTMGAKSLSAAGTTSLTVAGSTDFSFRVVVTGTPGTGAINYTLSIR